MPAQKTFDRTDPAFFDSHVVKLFPALGALASQPDRVTLRMRLRPIALEVLDVLIDGGDLEPSVRSAMLTFEVGPLLEWTPDAGTVVSVEQGFPISCVSPNGLTVADKVVPGPAHQRCSP